jgi:predicted dehydrogenase
MALHYRVNAGYIPKTHWVQDPASGGGRIIGEVCHFIDLLGFLCGSRVREVFAVGLPDGGRYSRDNASITLRFDDASVGTISYVANGDRGVAKERIEVFTGGRAAVLDDFRSLTLSEGGRRRHHRSAADKGHSSEMSALVKAVLAGQPSPVPFDESVAVTRATFAALQSLATGQPIATEAVV